MWEREEYVFFERLFARERREKGQHGGSCARSRGFLAGKGGIGERAGSPGDRKWEGLSVGRRIEKDSDSSGKVGGKHGDSERGCRGKDTWGPVLKGKVLLLKEKTRVVKLGGEPIVWSRQHCEQGFEGGFLPFGSPLHFGGKDGRTGGRGIKSGAGGRCRK